MSYRSPSNPRTPSHKPGFQFHQTNNPVSMSYSQTPHGNLYNDEPAPFLSYNKHSRTKTSATSGRVDFQNPSSLETREKKLEEQFHQLLDRCNKSKEFISNMQKMVYGEGNQDTTHLYASTPNLQMRSPAYSTISTATRNLQDFEPENKYLKRSEKKASQLYESRNGFENDEYEKLENDVIGLKKSILDRLKKKETGSINKKIQFKINKEDLTSDEEERREINLREDWNTSREKSPIKKYERTSQGNYKTGKREEERTNYVKGIKEEKTRAEKSLNKLKTTLQEKERVTQEKYVNLKGKCKELKNILRDYVTRVVDLEEGLKKKDEQIIELEEQFRKGQDELIKSEEAIEEYKKNEEILRRSEVEVKNTNIEYKMTLTQQREKIESLEEAVRRNKDKYKGELLHISEENDRLKIEVEILKEKETGLLRRNDDLEREAENLKVELEKTRGNIGRLENQKDEREFDLKELRGQLEKLKAENGILEAKVKEMKEVLKQSNDRIIAEERKHEEELNRLREEKEKVIFQKKEKISFLKQQIRDLEDLSQKAIEEKKFVNLELERALGQKQTLEKDLIRIKEELKIAKEEINHLRVHLETLKSQNDEIHRNLQAESDEAVRLQSENRRYEKLIETLEDKLGLEEKEAVRFGEINDKLKNEVKNLLEENSQSREKIDQLENQLNYVQDTQAQELSNIEVKIQQFSQDIRNLKEENAGLRSLQEELTKELETVSGDRDKYKKDYKNLKQINRALEKDIRELDLKIKDASSEKVLEVEDHNKEINNQRQLHSKLKVLDEIQGMIKTHRLSQRKV